jgi:hypothetical protein
MKQTNPHGNVYKKEHNVEQLKFIPGVWQTLKNQVNSFNIKISQIVG